MLMNLLWTLVEPMVTGLLDLLPDAPDPVDLELPWPNWLPFWPFATVLALVLLVGLAALAVRFARWVYGLIPVIQ